MKETHLVKLTGSLFLISRRKFTAMGLDKDFAESKEKTLINYSPKLHLYNPLQYNPWGLHKDVKRLSFVLLFFCSKAVTSGFTQRTSAAGNFSDFVEGKKGSWLICLTKHKLLNSRQSTNLQHYFLKYDHICIRYHLNRTLIWRKVTGSVPKDVSRYKERYSVVLHTVSCLQICLLKTARQTDLCFWILLIWENLYLQTYEKPLIDPLMCSLCYSLLQTSEVYVHLYEARKIWLLKIKIIYRFHSQPSSKPLEGMKNHWF